MVGLIYMFQIFKNNNGSLFPNFCFLFFVIFFNLIPVGSAIFGYTLIKSSHDTLTLVTNLFQNFSLLVCRAAFERERLGWNNCCALHNKTRFSYLKFFCFLFWCSNLELYLSEERNKSCDPDRKWVFSVETKRPRCSCHCEGGD